MVLPVQLQAREQEKFVEDETGQTAVNVVLKAADIEIGAVEIKDHDGADRVEITSSNEMKVIATDIGCTMTEVDLETDADVVVTAAPAHLLGLYANVVFSAHAVNVIDNVTTKLVLPASMAAGTKIDCHSAIFATNLSINSDNAATGKLVVFWKAI